MAQTLECMNILVYGNQKEKNQPHSIIGMLIPSLNQSSNMEQKPIMQLNDELGAMLKMPKHKSFEEFLQEKFADGYEGTDDDMPDRFDAWVSDFEAEEVMTYAQQYGDSLTK